MSLRMINVTDYCVSSIIMYYKDVDVHTLNRNEHDVMVIWEGESVNESQMEVSCNGCTKFSVCIIR